MKRNLKVVLGAFAIITGFASTSMAMNHAVCVAGCLAAQSAKDAVAAANFAAKYTACLTTGANDPTFDIEGCEEKANKDYDKAIKQNGVDEIACEKGCPSE